MNNMYGNFVWWQGVVEDRTDPLFLGRCRVRILGYHTDNKEDGKGIPTVDLPWATPSQPITSAGINGIGTSPTGPVEGTWVFGFFRDGENAQEPVIIGTFGGIPEEKPNTTVGFNDPNGVYPTQEVKEIAPWNAELNEPDTNRLAVNDTEKEHPVIQAKKDARDKNATEIPRANNSDSPRPSDLGKITPDNVIVDPEKWTEPEVPYATVYPKNHVRQSESGHIQEWDDTTDKERLHTYHKEGTFEEIHPDGTRVHKIVGDNYTVIGTSTGDAKNDNIHIMGTCNITIDANANWYVKGNVEQQIDGDWNITCYGKKNEYVKKSVTEIYDDTQDTTVTEAVTETYKATQDTTVTDAVQETYNSTQTTNVTSQIELTGESTYTADIASNVVVTGSRIDLN